MARIRSAMMAAMAAVLLSAAAGCAAAAAGSLSPVQDEPMNPGHAAGASVFESVYGSTDLKLGPPAAFDEDGKRRPSLPDEPAGGEY